MLQKRLTNKINYLRTDLIDKRRNQFMCGRCICRYRMNQIDSQAKPGRHQQAVCRRAREARRFSAKPGFVLYFCVSKSQR